MPVHDDSDIPGSSAHDAIAQQAALWVSRIDLGRADDGAFERWRSADPRHAVAFARLAATWSSVKGIEIASALPAAERTTRRTMLKAGFAAAATLGGGGVLVSHAYARQSASTGVGEVRLVKLPDTSVLALNTDSAASWRFGSGEAELWLDRGEMSVDLRPGHGFTLTGGDAAAQLTPGRFNARLKGGVLDVMVLRGAATAAGGSASAQQSLLLTTSGPVVRAATSQEVAATLAWQRGEILFLDEPLGSAVEEYNRYLARKILIDDPQLGTIRVGGRFTSKDPAAFLEALHTSLGINVAASDGNVHLTRN